jgi:hypothetical protein
LGILGKEIFGLLVVVVVVDLEKKLLKLSFGILSLKPMLLVVLLEDKKLRLTGRCISL